MKNYVLIKLSKTMPKKFVAGDMRGNIQYITSQIGIL